MAFSLGELVQQTAVGLGLSGVANFRASRRVEAASKPSVLGALRVQQSHGLADFGILQKSRVGLGNSSVGVGVVVRAGPESATPVKPSSNKKKYPGEAKGFVEEMRFVAMKLHTKDQSKEGEKEDKEIQPVAKWQPTVEGYLKFLVNSKKVYDTLEEIVQTAVHPSYAEFQNTGLERSARLEKDLEWFASEGHEIPPLGDAGKKYAELLKNLSETDPPAFICHFYNVYFAHSAGGKFIGQKVADVVIDGKVLEFYKWDGDLQTLLANVKEKLNKVAQEWTREQKDHCLKETEMSFKYSGELLRLIVS
ncbi:unnamed protein product [Calypogeia fissa]